MSPAELARAAGRFEAVAEVVDFGRHVPPQSVVSNHFDSTISYVYIVNRNSLVSIQSTAVSLLAEAGRMMRSLLNISTFRCTTKSNRHVDGAARHARAN
jgi:hypothetical protein